MDFSVDSEGMNKILSTSECLPPVNINKEIDPVTEKAFAGINAGYVAGFKTAECNIEDLG
mgnify:CR=1 FL=1